MLESEAWGVEALAYGIVFAIGAAVFALVGGCFGRTPSEWRKGSGLRGPRDADEFAIANGYSWDWAIAVRVYDSKDELSKIQLKYSLRKLMERLAHAELETRACFVAKGEFVLVKVRASAARLRREATKSGYLLELDSVALEKRARKGEAQEEGGWAWRPLELAADARFCKYAPFAHAHCAFDERPELAELWRRRGRGGSVLRGVDRMRLLRAVIEAPVAEGGCELPLAQLVRENVLQASFAIHDYEELASLQAAWLHARVSKRRASAAPLAEVRDYFGEAIAFYFAFVQFYGGQLWLLALLGAGAWVWSVVSLLADARVQLAQPVFGCATAVWAASVARSWRTRETALALEWGTTGCERAEIERPEYRAFARGQLIDSPVDGKSGFLYVPEGAMLDLRIMSTIAWVGCLCAIAGLVALELALKALVTDSSALSEIAFGLLDALRVALSSTAIRRVAVYLATQENHKTHTQHVDALAGYALTLELTNQFAALAYVAFLKPFVGGCSYQGQCARELQTLVATTFLVRSAWGLLYTWRSAVSDGALLDFEDKSALAAEDDLDLFDDYARLLLQLGYVSLFGMVFPPLAGVAWVVNYATSRLDAAQLCSRKTRAAPVVAEDLGTWGAALSVLATAAAASNAIIICYTGPMLDGARVHGVSRLLVFIALEHSLLLVRFVAELVPLDGDARIQRQRTAFILSKVVQGVRDEDDDVSIASSAAHTSKLFVPDFVIADNDDDFVSVG